MLATLTFLGSIFTLFVAENNFKIMIVINYGIIL